ncbi:phage baseplate assembly protein V [Acidovorax radicis]|uniref:phage baseplate assembly protein V n=1 Tax=Acidovorax radicis TaxID=758826 RepID=UPI00030903F7|nr:phage baseplate assembly protein V [Acidovorax radicis]
MERPVDQPESPIEILRRLENIARVGTIEEVRTGKPARCRIRCGDVVTNWVPWIAGRAAGEAGSVWWPPVKGEQVLMLAPGGDLMNAVVLPGAYSDKNPQASDNPKMFRMDFGGAGFLSHDADGGLMKLEAVGSIVLAVMSSSITITESSIVIAAGGASLTIDAQGVTGSPDVLAQGISLVNHLHPGVKRGSEETDPPV